MKLVIAEKPMLARDIARAVCGVQVSEKSQLPISGNGYTVIACSGHLLELVEPDAVNPAWADRYDLDLLPISIPDWPKEPAVVRNRETGEVIDSKEPLIDKIAALLPQADLVIHAGDPDDEGQLIVDEVLDYLGYIGEVLRVYVNDNITKNIVRAFDHLVPNEGCRAAGAAANARSIADKCFGVNESRLASTRLHGGFYVGRVQTPTLGLVVARDEAIENHVTRKFYELTATGGCPDADSRPTFKFKPGKDMLAGEKHVFDAAPLETIKAKMDGSDATFTTVISEKTENPPLPYNLTVLLSDMSERFGFTAAKTQQITQDLRDKYKAITYNRSDSQYLKEEHFAQAPAVLAQAMENVGATWPLDYSIHSKAFNEKNVTAHHGIIPQEIEVPVGDMTEDEVKVYTAIVERYAAQFLPPAVYDVSTSSFEAEGGTFQAVSTRLREAGFKSVFPHMSKSGKADGDVSKNPWSFTASSMVSNFVILFSNALIRRLSLLMFLLAFSSAMRTQRLMLKPRSWLKEEPSCLKRLSSLSVSKIRVVLYLLLLPFGFAPIFAFTSIPADHPALSTRCRYAASLAPYSRYRSAFCQFSFRLIRTIHVNRTHSLHSFPSVTCQPSSPSTLSSDRCMYLIR